MAYRGSVIRLPIGMQGFSGSRNPSQMQPGHLADAEGVTLDGGLIQKEGGAVKLNSSALGAGSVVISGISYSPLADVWRDAVFLSNGTILKDSGAGTFPTTLASGLTADREPPPWFVTGGGEAVGSPRTLFCFSTSNQVRAVDGDGASMAAITTPPADWAGAGNFPPFGIIHEGRLWGGGNASDPHRLYYSTLTDHQNFTGTGSGSISIFPGEGERLVGAVSFKGLLVAFKYPRGVYFVTTTDPAPAGWRVDRLSTAVGSLNQHTIVPIDNDTLYMDSTGNMHLLSATNAFGGVQTSNISQRADMADFFREEVEFTNIRRSVGVWYGDKQQAMFALPRTNSTDNNLRVTVDFSDPQVGFRFLPSLRDTPVSMWIRQDTDGVFKPVHGDASGFVWKMDQEIRSKDGVGFDTRLETSDMDLGFANPILATKFKSGDFLEIKYEATGDWDLTVTVIWDRVPGPPILFSMGGLGGALGSFTLDSDVLSATGQITSIRKRIAGSGRRVRIKIEQSGANQNIALSDFYLSFRMGDERQR